ncbi:MAG TPA: stage II sporulation protein M [Phenylobacterium sp.]|uniref:stage II sporulation protein M n=1 Tax=Phenylobacterium sp. TaxID=1871053 RepID=UPI002B495DF3|nr:stage II sporulation protein M [Phenylobacterium sp.]HKR86626.1 stage II sporulation protein M [Phenylobacterium sp.]
MAELQLKSHRFRAEREADWRRLERLLDRAEKSGVRRLQPAELLEIPVLYRQALSSLSVARAISLDQGLVDYLEALSSRAYFFVYGARTSAWTRIAGFFRHDWPEAVRGLWRETVVAAAITALAAVVAFGLVVRDPDWFYSFVPQALAAGREPHATTEFLRGTLQSGKDHKDGLEVLATFLFTHNSQIALYAFAFGFAFCVLTAVLLVANGGTLGAFLALFAQHGLAAPAVGWLMIHGVTELFAVTLAGAAGLSIGWAVAFPGARTRMDAVMHVGRRGALVMAGVVVMLFFAALLEGFARQLIQADWARYAIAAATAVVWGAYFYLPRGRRRAR